MRLALAFLVVVALVLTSCQQAAPAATKAPEPTKAAQPAATQAPAPAATQAPKPAATQAPAWAPTKPIEFVVHASAGGGSDIMARTIADIIGKEKLIPQTIVVNNKPGGSGAIAFDYVYGKKGDAYTWLTGAASFVTTPITQNLKYRPKDFTIVAVMGLDEYYLLVKYDAPYKSVKELVDKAKANPKGLKVGGTQVGSADSIASALVEKAAGVQFSYVPFAGGGEVMAALLGGHIDMAWANPGEALEQIEAKKARPLAVAAEKRIEAAPDVPTFKELGYNVVYNQFRAIIGPGEMPKEARDYYAAALKKMTETTAWKDGYLKKNFITPAFMEGEAATKYMNEQDAFYSNILKELGVIK